eukprot:scaffold54682_cov14-Prasinocladus_malaysianus.AAC.1
MVVGLPWYIATVELTLDGRADGQAWSQLSLYLLPIGGSAGSMIETELMGVHYHCMYNLSYHLADAVGRLEAAVDAVAQSGGNRVAALKVQTIHSFRRRAQER